MTDNTTEEITTEETGTEVEDTTYEPPFLRISSTFPTAAGRVEHIVLELNLRDHDPVGEYDADNPGETAAAKSWVLDLVTTTLRAVTTTIVPTTVMVTGSGSVREVLARHMRHAEDCDGNCGQQAGRSDQATPTDGKDA